MRKLSACLSQLVVTVVLQVTVMSSRIDFTHTRGSSKTWSFIVLCLAQNRHISSRNVIRYTSLERYTYTWHVHCFPDTTSLTFLGSSSRWVSTAPIYVNLSVVLPSLTETMHKLLKPFSESLICDDALFGQENTSNRKSARWDLVAQKGSPSFVKDAVKRLSH